MKLIALLAVLLSDADGGRPLKRCYTSDRWCNAASGPAAACYSPYYLAEECPPTWSSRTIQIEVPAPKPCTVNPDGSWTCGAVH